jgi:hypothetical protein
VAFRTALELFTTTSNSKEATDFRNSEKRQTETSAATVLGPKIRIGTEKVGRKSLREKVTENRSSGLLESPRPIML